MLFLTNPQQLNMKCTKVSNFITPSPMYVLEEIYMSVNDTFIYESFKSIS